MVKKHDIQLKMIKEYFGYIFVETDKGILLVAPKKREIKAIPFHSNLCLSLHCGVHTIHRKPIGAIWF